MPAYYNEIDPYAAAWLRNLIAAGHIASGDVDERSICEATHKERNDGRPPPNPDAPEGEERAPLHLLRRSDLGGRAVRARYHAECYGSCADECRYYNDREFYAYNGEYPERIKAVVNARRAAADAAVLGA